MCRFFDTLLVLLPKSGLEIDAGQELLTVAKFANVQVEQIDNQAFGLGLEGLEVALDRGWSALDRRRIRPEHGINRLVLLLVEPLLQLIMRLGESILGLVPLALVRRSDIGQGIEHLMNRLQLFAPDLIKGKQLVVIVLELQI